MAPTRNDGELVRLGYAAHDLRSTIISKYGLTWEMVTSMVRGHAPADLAARSASVASLEIRNGYQDIGSILADNLRLLRDRS